MAKKKIKKSSSSHRSFSDFIKEHIFFLLLIPIVIYTQFFILQDHFLYGFGDVDWGFLAFYKSYKELYPNIITNFIQTFKSWGVYAHQSYYIGLQGEFFGLDYKSYQITTHVFKALAILAFYPVFLLLSGRKSIAFLATFLFAFSYPAVGTLYTTVTSSDYSAVLTLAFFLWIYILLVKKRLVGWKWILTALFLLLATLFLSTERIYPLLFFLAVVEIGLFLLFKKTKESIKNQLTRVLILFSPCFVVFLVKPMLFVDFVARNGAELFGRIFAGHWVLIMTPFTALGSMFLPHNYWHIFGVIKTESMSAYFEYFLFGPFIIFTLITLILGIIIFRSRFFILSTGMLFPFFGWIVYILSQHKTEQFDNTIIAPTLMGGYIVIIGFVAFLAWLRQKKVEYFQLFLGPFFAFLFILTTWIAADTRLVFSGAHRYLTLPGLAMSFFLAMILGLLCWNLWQRKSILRFSAILPLFILIPFLTISVDQIQVFFKDQLQNGFGAYDKDLMRNQLRSYIKDLPNDKPSLFSFTFKDDPQLGYYYDNTLLAGFQTWMLWHDHINFNAKLSPDLLWNEHEVLPSVVKEKDGVKGIIWREKFYDKNHFYAFKLKNKKVIDITAETKKQLGLEE